MHFRQHVQIEITSGVGEWPYATLIILRKRGNLLSYFDPRTEYNFSSYSNGRIFAWELLDETEIGDQYGATIFYPINQFS